MWPFHGWHSIPLNCSWQMGKMGHNHRKLFIGPRYLTCVCLADNWLEKSEQELHHFLLWFLVRSSLRAELQQQQQLLCLWSSTLMEGVHCSLQSKTDQLIHFEPVVTACVEIFHLKIDPKLKSLLGSWCSKSLLFLSSSAPGFKMLQGSSEAW